MAAHDPPWRLDPLKNIVNVGWGAAGFVALQFSASATSDEGGEGGGTPGQPVSVNPVVHLQQIGASFPIFGFEVSSKIARNPKPVYHKETTTHEDGETVTIQTYDVIVTYNHPPNSGSAAETIYVTTIGTDEFWSGFYGGTENEGGIDAAEAFLLANGWDTFEATLVQTDTSTTDPVDTKSIEDVGVIIFSLGAIRAALPEDRKDDPTLIIEFSSGSSPGRFSWRAVVGSYRKVTFNSFPLDDKNKPVGWKDPISTSTDSGSRSKNIRFEVDFKTLHVSHT